MTGQVRLNPTQIRSMMASVEVFGQQTNRITDFESLRTKGFPSRSEYKDPFPIVSEHTLSRRLWGRSVMGGSPWAGIVAMVRAASSGLGTADSRSILDLPPFNLDSFRSKADQLYCLLQERQLEALKVSGPRHILKARITQAPTASSVYRLSSQEASAYA